ALLGLGRPHPGRGRRPLQPDRLPRRHGLALRQLLHRLGPAAVRIQGRGRDRRGGDPGCRRVLRGTPAGGVRGLRALPDAISGPVPDGVQPSSLVDRRAAPAPTHDAWTRAPGGAPGRRCCASKHHRPSRAARHSRAVGPDRRLRPRAGRRRSPATMSSAVAVERPLASARRLILPLAQFICSFAGSNMNVMIADISDDLDTTVKGVQTAITLFLLIMAILMIPCSKLTDRWGRKRCFMWGLTIYGIGALISAISPNLGVLILGNSVFEGVGTALLIPPVYILATLWFSDMTKRAWAFGVISGLGGIGAAAGPLIGGVITTAISWRAAFVFQALVVATIVLLSRRLVDPLPADPTRPFDLPGAVLSAVGLVLLVTGILAADNNVLAMVALLAAG